ncbi:MAG: hypothetical protein VB144_09565 [Clostridia bacterium]|nr:hypothetical protein [Clostridia bacterium]
MAAIVLAALLLLSAASHAFASGGDPIGLAAVLYEIEVVDIASVFGPSAAREIAASHLDEAHGIHFAIAPGSVGLMGNVGPHILPETTTAREESERKARFIVLQGGKARFASSVTRYTHGMPVTDEYVIELVLLGLDAAAGQSRTRITLSSGGYRTDGVTQEVALGAGERTLIAVARAAFAGQAASASGDATDGHQAEQAEYREFAVLLTAMPVNPGDAEHPSAVLFAADAFGLSSAFDRNLGPRTGEQGALASAAGAGVQMILSSAGTLSFAAYAPTGLEPGSSFELRMGSNVGPGGAKALMLGLSDQVEVAKWLRLWARWDPVGLVAEGSEDYAADGAGGAGSSGGADERFRVYRGLGVWEAGATASFGSDRAEGAEPDRREGMLLTASASILGDPGLKGIRVTGGFIFPGGVGLSLGAVRSIGAGSVTGNDHNAVTFEAGIGFYR